MYKNNHQFKMKNKIINTTSEELSDCSFVHSLLSFTPLSSTTNSRFAPIGQVTSLSYLLRLLVNFILLVRQNFNFVVSV